MESETTLDLCGKVLIAMPGMGDQRFVRSVIYVCAYSEDGAMGLIINKPTPGVSFTDLLDRLEIVSSPGIQAPPVHFGGPVEHGRGFVLHTADYTAADATLRVDDRFSMTATVDVLEAIAHGVGPSAAMLALGYSGWGPGQLEDEILQNGWLIGEADNGLVFGQDDDSKWSSALQTLGVDPLMLSPVAGRA